MKQIFTTIATQANPTSETPQKPALRLLPESGLQPFFKPAEIETSGETCPLCGADLKHVSGGLFSAPLKITCACIIEKEKRVLELHELHLARVKKDRLRRAIEKAFHLDWIKDMTFETFKDKWDDQDYRKQKQTAEQFCQKYSPETHLGILMYGSCGRGKTHLASAIANALATSPSRTSPFRVSSPVRDVPDEYDPSTPRPLDPSAPSICLFDSPTFFAALQEQINKENGSTNSIVSLAKDADILIWDDIDKFKPTEWRLEIAFSILNFRLHKARKKPVIATTNCDVHTLAKLLGAPIASRLMEFCHPLHFDGKLDYRQKKYAK